jgi:hypothetical protein
VVTALPLVWTFLKNKFSGDAAGNDTKGTN